MQRAIAKSIRIVFMGTPDFAVESLRRLVEEDYNIVGVITAPDKPSGRGQKIRSSAVKEYAKSQDLKILQPTNLKSEEFNNELIALNPELQVVVAFRMLPKSVWALPKYGTFNLHASLLPNYRGAAPIHWAIINGEAETGATTFFIDEKIDTGAILLKRKIDISETETVGQLHDKLMVLGAELVLETVDGIANNQLQPIPQSTKGPLKTAYKLNRDNCKIDWQNDVKNIYDKIRGLNPFPTAWCYFHHQNTKQMVKVYKSSYRYETHNRTYGSINPINDHLEVAAKNGFILIYEIQLPSKRKMDVKSLLNGLNLNLEDKLS